MDKLTGISRSTVCEMAFRSIHEGEQILGPVSIEWFGFATDRPTLAVEVKHDNGKACAMFLTGQQCLEDIVEYINGVLTRETAPPCETMTATN
jgi:hypothetical protein